MRVPRLIGVRRRTMACQIGRTRDRGERSGHIWIDAQPSLQAWFRAGSGPRWAGYAAPRALRRRIDVDGRGSTRPAPALALASIDRGESARFLFPFGNERGFDTFPYACWQRAIPAESALFEQLAGRCAHRRAASAAGSHGGSMPRGSLRTGRGRSGGSRADPHRTRRPGNAHGDRGRPPSGRAPSPPAASPSRSGPAGRPRQAAPAKPPRECSRAQ